jgi:tetratricopeptide (TPR) repeat protein
MADSFARRGQHDKARQEYWAILSYYPERSEPYLKMAASYEAEKSWAGAEKACQAALANADRQGLIFYRMAMAQWQQKKVAAAIQTIQKAIVAPELSPEQRTVAKYYLAGFFIDAKRMDFAAKVLQDILQEDPTYQPALEMKQKYFEK